MNVRWLPPLVAVLCGLLTIEHSQEITQPVVTAVLPTPGQRCGTVCLLRQPDITFGSFKRLLKTLCLVSWAAAPFKGAD